MSKVDPTKIGKPPEIPVLPKVDTGKIEQTIKDAVKKARDSKLELPQFDTRDIGTKVRGAILNGLQELNNNPALKDIQEQIGQQVGAAIGKKIGEWIGNSPVGEFARNVAEKAQDVVATIQVVTDSLASIKQGDAAGGLNGIAIALNNIGQTQAGTKVGELATEVQPLQDKFSFLRDSIKGSTDSLLTLTNNQGKIAGALSTIGAAAGPLAAGAIAGKELADQLERLPAFQRRFYNPDGSYQNPIDEWASHVPGLDIINPPRSKPPGFSPQNPPPDIPRVGNIPVPGLVPSRPPAAPPTKSPPGTVGGIPIPGLQEMPRRAGGGMADVLNGLIRGPGTGVSDSILGWPAMVRVSNGEFITNEEDTAANLPLLQAVNSGVPLWDWLRSLPRFDAGGLVPGSAQLRKIISERFGITNIGGYRAPDGYNEHSSGRALDVMVGNDKAKGDAVKDFALANASAIDLKWAIWQQRMWYPGGRTEPMSDRGSPTQNHMDHVHIFSGPGITNGLLGALQGQGPATTPQGKGDAAGTPAGLKDIGSAAAAAAPAGVTPAAGTGGSSGGSSGGFTLPTSLSDMAGFALSGLGAGVGATQSGSDLSLFGKAAESAISGQVSSALGVFGVPSSPGWLQGISKFIGGISVGGPGGGGPSTGVGAIPAALPGAPGFPPAAPAGVPDSVKGVSAPPQGHIGDVINIQTDRVEDAFKIAWQHKLEKAAASLSRWG
ncbi:hypothetical protein A5725_12045 [Mycobacterium kubicae]|uniref:hypothetical protein n=1 Tax=Mycobacterium kubicae TaxID=120959 RepID=UPI0007FD40C8|nr:hypothetical protein [Mycobacterium kubicae]OBF22923.1 hypothetical protein A5725_12045 [Mycobacterium kubicae]